MNLSVTYHQHITNYNCQVALWGHEELVRRLLGEQLERWAQSKTVLRGLFMEDSVMLTARAMSC